MRGLVMVFVALLGLSLPVQAQRQQGPQQVLEEAGLIGVFQGDCGRPPSPDNVRSTYAVAPEGGVMLTYDQGPTRALWVIHILEAGPLAPGRVTYLSEAVTDGNRLRVIVTLDGGRLRVLSSQQEKDGKFLVRDGKFTSSGRDSPLQERCGRSKGPSSGGPTVPGR